MKFLLPLALVASLSGCGLMTALDGNSTKTFVSADATCRSYGFALSTVAKVADIMSDEQVGYVEDARKVANPVCASPTPPSNDIATVQALTGGILSLAVQMGGEAVLETEHLR